MAYKTFANGFPLPASDLNNFLMDQSVIVFANSAARGTAIPSPVQGMLTYLEDTSAYESWNGSAYVALVEDPDLTALIPKSTVTTSQDLIVADGASSVTRLGVGTDDQVLSVVSGSVAWADASGGGGDSPLVLLASGSIPTGGASSTISGFSGNDVYFFYFRNLTTSSATDFYGYLNGTITGKSVAHRSANNGSAAAAVEPSTAYPFLGRVNNSGTNFSCSITVRGGSHTGFSIMTGSGGSAGTVGFDQQSSFEALQNKGGAVLDSITLILQAGTFSGGSYEIYGA